MRWFGSNFFSLPRYFRVELQTVPQATLGGPNLDTFMRMALEPPLEASVVVQSPPASRTVPRSEAAARSEEGARWEALVARMQARDTAAFESAMQLTREAGWRLAFQMVGDAHLAQDILQDAYLVVFTRLDTLRDPAVFRSWFLRIVCNQCRNTIRRKQRETPVEDVPEAGGRGFEERVTNRLAVSKALADLTALERTSVLLRDYLQLSYQEIADVLRVPLGTVKSRLNEARKQLLRRLKGADAR
jgi:RNA polymerase sigma-70 factor, ECF subfamily